MKQQITGAGHLGTLALATLLTMMLVPATTTARRGAGQGQATLRGMASKVRFDVSPPLAALSETPPVPLSGRIREIPERSPGLPQAFGPSAPTPAQIVTIP
jgi:hypothetical protein